MARLGMNRETHGEARLALVPPDGAAAPLLQQELVDVVDLDPYGTVSPFLDNAFRCVKEGGLLLLTSTDSPILCGNFPDTCHAKYNSISYKGDHCHEMAVRLLLAAVERVANKHKKYVVPLLSLHIDFYVRCFLRVYTQPAETKLSVTKLGHQLQCTQCPAFWVRPMARARVQEKKQKRARETEAGPAPADAPVAGALPPPEAYPAPADRARQPKVTAALLEQLLQQGAGSCPVCGGAVTISGPLYAAPTQHRAFLTELLACIETREAAGQLNAYGRVKGLVQTALEELPHAPLFYDLPELASYAQARCPPTPLFVGALARLGYSCSQVHCAPAGLKTDCPPDVVMRVMLAWRAKARAEEAASQAQGAGGKEEATTTQAHPGEGRKKPQKQCLLSPLEGVDFSYEKQYDYRRQATGMCKFIPNAPGWGPKRRHQGAQQVDEEGAE
ncbi:tRNA (guanine-N2-)-methyltransferase [Strigomonas culicis]|uniref:tRNA (guanine(26)-N(2))-dimethyltransferase n=1 Tax=Strigomonas culicis TaxID=28005 RepID=S9VNZ9_9TRYP|nr:tRNA (guanine-N2-)-methyltransferase [Strigomonas culicis]|eukprot:EPY28731.1 tRNA (guanine-N2-)-methyltransferase [Strigomonas culicis]